MSVHTLLFIFLRFIHFDSKTSRRHTTQFVSFCLRKRRIILLSSRPNFLIFSYFRKRWPLYVRTLVSGRFFPFHYPYEQYFILDSLTIQEFLITFSWHEHIHQVSNKILASLPYLNFNKDLLLVQVVRDAIPGSDELRNVLLVAGTIRYLCFNPF